MQNPTRHRSIHRAGTGEDAAVAATIIAQAFSPLPVCEWLVPDARQRVRVLAAVFDITVEHALNFGVVDLLTQTASGASGAGADGVVGVAVWFDRTRAVPGPPDYEERLQAATGTGYARFAALDQVFDQHHPAGPPHHHLAFLAVTPGHQGTGIGTTLLEHHHRRLDARQVPAYLEASSEASARLYTRHGYTRHGFLFEVAEGAPFVPMWRDPTPGGPA